MANFSTEHILLLLGTIIFLVASCYGVSKLSRKWQNVVFIVTAVLGSGGVFFRYAMNLKFTLDIRLDTLFIQALQVCNFNFILLPLMLIPKFELARQYSIFFSMIAASTVMLSIPSSYSAYNWYDITLLNFWFNHVFAVALPLYMLSSGRLKPSVRYILSVTVCVVLYFTLVFGITALLWELEVLPRTTSFSYVYDPKGMPIITQLYSLIGLPFVHLLPLVVVLVGFFYLFSMPFTKKVYIHFNGNVKKLYGTKGYKLKLSSKSFEKAGLTLLGFKESETGEVKYKPNEVITLGKQNLNLYAELKEN